MSVRGTVSITSRESEVTMGMIMMARMIPAVRKDRPVAVPNSRPTSGKPPKVSCSHP